VTFDQFLDVSLRAVKLLTYLDSVDPKDTSKYALNFWQILDFRPLKMLRGCAPDKRWVDKVSPSSSD